MRLRWATSWNLNRIHINVAGARVLEYDRMRAGGRQSCRQYPALLERQRTPILTERVLRLTVAATIDPDFYHSPIGIPGKEHRELRPGEGNACSGVLHIRTT